MRISNEREYLINEKREKKRWTGKKEGEKSGWDGFVCVGGEEVCRECEFKNKKFRL